MRHVQNSPHSIPFRREILTLLSAASIVLFLVGLAGAYVGPPPAGGYAPNQIIVTMRQKPTGTMSLSTLAYKLGWKVLSSKGTLGPGLLQLPKGADPAAAVKRLRQIPEVRYAELNSMRHALLAAPDDPAYNDIDTTTYYQWDLYTIQALEGWSVWPNTYYTAATKPLDSVKVAVIDTGIDRTHLDFMNAEGTSTHSLLGGQIDWADSANLISYYSGSAPSFDDENGHGTHVAGTIAAAANNGQSYDMDGGGIAGIGYNGQIMAVKIFNAWGEAFVWDSAKAITYAADRGARVMNCSYGGYYYSQLEQDAVNYAWSKGALVVAAAGNDSTTWPSYPAGCDRVQAVSATNSDDGLTSYSNWGEHLGIAAPGGDTSAGPDYLGIWSTMPSYFVFLNWYGYGGYYTYLEGTSMATPHVAGLATLYAGYQKSATGSYPTPLGMYQAIQRGADNIGSTADGGWEPVFGYGRMNVYNTMAGLNVRSATVGCITGQVLLRRSTPLAGATVTAVPVGGGSSYSTTTRDDDGCYRLANLPEGSYDVTATYSAKTSTVSDVAVAAGCDMPGIDFTFDPPPTSAIMGRVSDYLTKWPLPARVWVRAASPSSGIWIAKVDADPSTGDYVIPRLKPGTYYMQVSAWGYRSAVMSSVVVSSDRTTWVNFSLRRGF